MIAIADSPRGAIVAVRVVPRARHSAIDGERGGALLVRIAAAPVDGAANDAVLDLLAGELNVSHRALRIIAGERTRSKRVAVAGMTADVLRRRLADILR